MTHVISNGCIKEWPYHNWLTTTSNIHMCFHIILLLFKYTLGWVTSFYLCVLLNLSSMLALMVCPASVAAKRIDSVEEIYEFLIAVYMWRLSYLRYYRVNWWHPLESLHNLFLANTAQGFLLYLLLLTLLFHITHKSTHKAWAELVYTISWSHIPGILWGYSNE